jgi:glycosyltransferase involved in cell wall biosynthesis
MVQIKKKKVNKKNFSKKEMLVSIIIPTLNEEKHLLKTINSLKSQTVPRESYEIIVSDSSSDDGTVALAKKHADLVVVCKRQSAGLGRNFGARHAKGKFLGFIDADTVASNTWVEGLIEALNTDSVVACTGPLDNLEKDSLKINLFYGFWNFQTQVSLFLGFPIIPGYNFGVRAKEFFDVNGFPEKNMVCEDIDLCERLAKKGKLVFSKKMGVKTSARRQKEIPIYRHMLSGIKFILTKKSMTWNEYRKDF